MQQFLSIARNQINVAFDEQDSQLSRDLKAAMAQAAAQGYLRSGRMVFELDRFCAAAITARGAAIWEIVNRCVRVGRVRYSPSLEKTLKEFCLPYLSGHVQGLTQRANSEVRHMQLPPLEVTESGAARDRAYRVLESEIELFCAALSVEPQDLVYQPQTVINMHGPNYGAVQSGENASANVTITSTVHQDIRSALDELKRELQGVNHAEAPMALVVESEREMAKPSPDKSRMRSLVDGVKACVSGAIDTAPKIPAAIEGVRRAIDML